MSTTATPFWRGRTRVARTPGEDLVARLFREHGSAMTGYAMRLTGDHQAAEDLVQEALVRAWRHHDELTDDRGSVKGWLFAVVRNLAYDRARHLARRPAEVETDPLVHGNISGAAAGSNDPAQGVVDTMVVRQALATLSDEHREVLRLLQFDGLSVAEAAERLGVPPGTVKSRTYYAMRMLRLAYSELGGTR